MELLEQLEAENPEDAALAPKVLHALGRRQLARMCADVCSTAVETM